MSSQKRHVVIVDDEPAMRGLLRDFFTSLGYQADCFSNANSALTYLRASAIPVSAIVSDIRMSPVDGIDFLKTLKHEFPAIPVILFTGAGGPDERDVAIQSGAAQYLQKPFSLTELRTVVDQFQSRAKRAK